MSRINFLITLLMMSLLVGVIFVYLKNTSYLSEQILVADPDVPTIATTTAPDSATTTSGTPTSTPIHTQPQLDQNVGSGVNMASTGVRFTGILESVNTGCFSDGECFVVVGGKHITLLTGRYQGAIGKIIGADSIGDLEVRTGEIVAVYAQKNGETYTLLGDDSYYLELATVSGGSGGNAGATSTQPVAADGCVIGGCSGQLCGEVEQGGGMVSTCEWREQYACFKTARCERQDTGKCGWSETEELKMCLLRTNN